MKIAIVTGASSGMGRRFAETCDKAGPFDEVWVIARRAERLEELKNVIPYPVRPIAIDLTDRPSVLKVKALLEEVKPDVGLLVNAGGFGRFEAFTDTPAEVNLNMVDLNCEALMSLTQYVLPYMSEGSAVINIASVAAFQPIPYINIYAATKAFVLYFSRALNRELKARGISVMAVCPFWTKTEFFERAVDLEKPAVVKKYIAMYDPKDIIDRAWRDLKRGKDVSKYGFKARAQAALCKILPHKIIMSVWMKQQKL
ncbi:MAG: SDR family NAD(P)-dependent oxidoreductase [Clostridia bacterium]|nr:SDR family NAD(P)-dependent oxidoreductase [Clostridia bacterium]